MLAAVAPAGVCVRAMHAALNGFDVALNCNDQSLTEKVGSRRGLCVAHTEVNFEDSFARNFDAHQIEFKVEMSDKQLIRMRGDNPMLMKSNKQSTTSLAAAVFAAALILVMDSGANAQSRGTFDNGDGTMGYRVTNDGRVLPVIDGGGAEQSVARRQLPAAARSSFGSYGSRRSR